MLRFVPALACLLLQGALALALEVPTLERRVTDLAGVLSAGQVDALEEKLRLLEETDSTQVAVLVIPGLEGEALEAYTLRVVEAWKLGQKGRDNGALLFVAMKDRAIRIEVGYGLEPSLTDARSRRIIQNDIAPRFRAGDFPGGIDAGVTGIIRTVQGTYQSDPGSEAGAEKPSGSLEVLFVLIFPLLWLLSITGKWGGGLIGAAAGAILPSMFFTPSLALVLTGGGLGAVAGFFLGAIAQAAAKAGGRPGSSSRGGHTGGFPGTFGGGFGRGGGFGGGGFGGGGGGFGGGGSSGSW
ncbi:MAG: TPM domain-containing protein [Acidobacteria bacterium]|jgi:uncharacterized protein|nr:TPM domain-containing protein [Acidobacteriota bacterium]